MYGPVVDIFRQAHVVNSEVVSFGQVSSRCDVTAISGQRLLLVGEAGWLGSGTICRLAEYISNTDMLATIDS